MSQLAVVRAKFKVDSIESFAGSPELVTIRMSPVYPNQDPNHENSVFWKYSPSGKLELGTINPSAAGKFELGKEYYIDFTPAA